MEKSMKRICLVVLAIIMAFSTSLIFVEAKEVSRDETNQYLICTPYDYSLKPGTNEWLESDPETRRSMSYLSLDYARLMTTDALFITVLEYPFLADIFAFDSLQYGVDLVKDFFPPLRELLDRSDASNIISGYCYECSNKGDIYNDIEYLTETKYFLAKSLLHFINNTANKNNNNSPTRYYIEPGTGLMYDYVSTPNNSPVHVYKNLDWGDMYLLFGGNQNDYTYAIAMSLCNQYLNSYPSSYLIRNPNPQYNCHSYAWYSTSSSNHYWMMYPNSYMTDGSYSQIFYPTAGAKITYSNSGNSITHSGILNSTTTVTSKWGMLGLFSHSITDCPYYYYGVTSISYWN